MKSLRSMLDLGLTQIGLPLVAASLLLFGACDDDDDLPSDPASPTPSTSPAEATSTVTPVTETDEGSVGIAEIDRVIDLVLTGGAGELSSLVRLAEVPCIETAEGLGGPPVCAAGEAPGTDVQVFPAAACEGYWLRDPAELIASFVEQVDGLYAVVESPADPPEDSFFPLGTHILIFEAHTRLGVEGFTLTLDGDAIVSLQTGCRPPEDFMTLRGEPLTVLLAPDANE